MGFQVKLRVKRWKVNPFFPRVGPLGPVREPLTPEQERQRRQYAEALNFAPPREWVQVWPDNNLPWHGPARGLTQ